MTTPTRSIDRKLEALQKRIEAELKFKPMKSAPTDGMTSTASTKETFVPNRPKGTAP